MATKRGNGTGTISKVKGRLRKPYRVRVTVGWEVDETTGKAKQIVKNLGYFATKKEASFALEGFINCPYNLNANAMLVKELYNLWIESYKNSLSSPSSLRSVSCAWDYATSIYNMRIRDVRAFHIEKCILDAYREAKDGQIIMASNSTKNRLKSVFNLMFDYAMKNDWVNTNYARALKTIGDEKIDNTKHKTPFTAKEVDILWQNVDIMPFTDMILCAIYTGLRPQEVALIEVDKVHIEDDYLIAGMKTTLGKNRIVPIHKDIKKLICNRLDEANKLGSKYLFNDICGQRGTTMTYDKYRVRFNKVISFLSLNSALTPHSTRTTWYTFANRCNVDPIMRDRIAGHKNKLYPMSNYYDMRDLPDLIKAANMVEFKDL